MRRKQKRIPTELLRANLAKRIKKLKAEGKTMAEIKKDAKCLELVKKMCGDK